MKQKTITKITDAQRKLIWAYKEKLSFEDPDEYRDLIKTWTGQSHISQLTAAQAVDAISKLQRLHNDDLLTKAQKFAINKLCKELEYNHSHLLNFIRRQTGKPFQLYALSKSDATKVITGLMKIKKERSQTPDSPANLE